MVCFFFSFFFCSFSYGSAERASGSFFFFLRETCSGREVFGVGTGRDFEEGELDWENVEGVSFYNRYLYLVCVIEYSNLCMMGSSEPNGISGKG